MLLSPQSHVKRPALLRLAFERASLSGPGPRARGDNTASGGDSGLTRFQSTPPREGRRRVVEDVHHFGGVSIHAPARGATAGRCQLKCAECVSIHAPARGATMWLPTLFDLLGGFNPRPRARGDVCTDTSIPFTRLFQSTPPREGRPAVSKARVRAVLVSIHAPARGATRQNIRGRGPTDVSIHAPARGATYGATTSVALDQSFNPRPRARGDHTSANATNRRLCFNPRPRARGD
mgnify:CR=1 FL=1